MEPINAVVDDRVHAIRSSGADLALVLGCVPPFFLGGELAFLQHTRSSGSGRRRPDEHRVFAHGAGQRDELET